MLRQRQCALYAVGQEEATQVEELGRLDHSLGVSALEVVLGELLGSAKVGTQRAVVASDHHSARAGSRLRVNLVNRLQSLTVVGSTQLVRQVIAADTAQVGS